MESNANRYSDSLTESRFRGEFCLTVIAASVLQAWQILQTEKAKHLLLPLRENNMTFVSNETALNRNELFLLCYTQNIQTQSEKIWLQALKSVTAN